MGSLLCWLGIHRWRPISWMTCNSHDTGELCTRCYFERCAGCDGYECIDYCAYPGAGEEERK